MTRPDFLIVAAYPVYCQITDAQIGSDYRVVGAGRSEKEAQASAARRAFIDYHNYGDTSFYVTRRGDPLTRLRADQLAAYDCDMPF